MAFRSCYDLGFKPAILPSERAGNLTAQPIRLTKSSAVGLNLIIKVLNKESRTVASAKNNNSNNNNSNKSNHNSKFSEDEELAMAHCSLVMHIISLNPLEYQPYFCWLEERMPEKTILPSFLGSTHPLCRNLITRLLNIHPTMYLDASLKVRLSSKFNLFWLSRILGLCTTSYLIIFYVLPSVICVPNYLPFV